MAAYSGHFGNPRLDEDLAKWPEYAAEADATDEDDVEESDDEAQSA